MASDDRFDDYKGYMDAADWPAALSIINSFKDLSRRNMVHKAKCTLETGNVTEARTQADAMVLKEPANPWFHRIRIEIAWQQKDIDAMLASAYAVLSSANVQQYPALVREGVLALARGGKLADAISLAASLGLRSEGEYFRFLYESKGIDIFDRMAPEVAPEQRKIPRRILQFWDKEIIPENIRTEMVRWKQAYPDFEYHLFNEKTAIQLCRDSDDHTCAEAIRIAPHPAQKPDIFRLYFLHRFGGIYLDADEIPSGDLRHVLNRSAKSQILWMRSDRLQEKLPLYCTNWFLAAAPGTSLIERALSAAVENTLFHRDDRNVHNLTGPFLLTRQIVLGFFGRSVLDTDFVEFADGREFICKNVKWRVDEFRINTWQDYAGV